MANDIIANTLVSNSHLTTVSNMNHKKPNVGVLDVPYITKAPVHDTIERKKLENPRVIFSLGKNKKIAQKENIKKIFLGLEIGALGIGIGFLIKALIKGIKKIKH